MEKHWAGNTAFWGISCMFLVLYLWLSWCRSKKIPQGNSKLSYYDEKSQVTMKVWKHSTGSSTAWAQPQLSSGRVPSTGFGEQAAVGCMTWVWSRVWEMGMSPAAGLIGSVRLTFCHTFFFLIRDGIEILLKTSSALWLLYLPVSLSVKQQVILLWSWNLPHAPHSAEETVAVLMGPHWASFCSFSEKVWWSRQLKRSSVTGSHYLQCMPHIWAWK